MEKNTKFYGSQVGESSVIDYTHTDMPLRLLIKDVYYFFVYIWALPWIIWPAYPAGPREFNELAITPQNLFCIIIHTILVILQLSFLIALPLSVLFPIWMVVAGIAAFMVLNWGLCRLLNGSEDSYVSEEKYAIDLPEHMHEQWVFLNGVAVGEHWMKANLNRLALTFGRPVLGIHNRTSGIIFDIIECLIQRNYGYATSDVRICFRLLKDVLYDPAKSKVIFILHSQGGIEGSLVLDWLLQELPQDLLAKLEVYTFGNAANHFNNPNRHVSSQDLIKKKYFTSVSTITDEKVSDSILNGASNGTPNGTSNGTTDDKKSIKVHIPSAHKESHPPASLTRSTSAMKDRAIGHIEHYAHTTDFVSIWGVLHFSTNRMRSRQLPRFLGRLFARSSGRGGHQFNQHYLDGMFPLKYDEATESYIGADEDNEFMNEFIKFGKEGAAMENAREAFDISWLGTRGFGSGEITTPVEVHGLTPRRRKKLPEEVQVKELSRLWAYRNGHSPREIPPMLVTEDGIVRTATL